MIDIINLSVQFSGNYLFEDVNLKILPQDKVALVGSNGTGKSTLLKILSGKHVQEEGKIQYKKGLKIGYLPQELTGRKQNLVFNEVRESIDIINRIESEESRINQFLNDIEITEAEKNKLLDDLGHLNEKKEHSEYYALDSKIEKILLGLGFSQANFNQPISELSGGWQMRVELAKILVSDNDMILLDEPTNHLDLDSLQWLVKFLKSYKGAIILVSHDRYFVNSICDKTLEIFNNDISFFKGNYNDYLQFKIERDERLKHELKEKQKKIKQTEDFIERFRYKASKAKQVQSRIKQLNKIELTRLETSEDKIHFRFIDSPQSGKIPLKASYISKSFGDNLVLNNINLQITRGEKVALVGPNGAGKTTFAKILSKQLEPDSGEIEFGHNTAVSYYAQDVVDNLDIRKDIMTEISDHDKENTTSQLRTILGAFLFHGDDVFKQIKVLSGGEKSRVALAKVLLAKANTIILDEPTNHLDFDSKRIVQNALTKFAGTLIIVSHDIDFLKPIITKVIEIRNNHIKEFYGGIDYYLSKTEELEYNEISKSSKKDLKRINKKDEKRIQAKKRQEEYEATKSLKEDIAELEKKIETLESNKDNLEKDLTKEEIYSNPEKALHTKKDFEKTKKDLDAAYDDWTALSHKLEEVVKEFNDRQQF